MPRMERNMKNQIKSWCIIENGRRLTGKVIKRIDDHTVIVRWSDGEETKENHIIENDDA